MAVGDGRWLGTLNLELCPIYPCNPRNPRLKKQLIDHATELLHHLTDEGVALRVLHQDDIEAALQFSLLYTTHGVDGDNLSIGCQG